LAFAQLAEPQSVQQQQQLQQQLAQLQQQIAQEQQQLSQITAQKNTLANKIKALKKQQTLLSLQIQATNLQISQLTAQIAATQAAIDSNNTQAAGYKNQIAGVIRAISQNDNYPFILTAVSQQKLSDVYAIYENYAQVSQGLGGLVDELNKTNTLLAAQQQQLAAQQDTAQNLLNIQGLQQAQLTDTVGQQNTLLSETKGKEADYQIVVNDTKQQAAVIQNRLYQLLGVSSQIDFGQAVQIAQWASATTGIQPAFLLAILTQESNLGKNVGTCNRPGDPPSKSWKVVMKPDRDQQPFLQITASLGQDPDITPVSCPMHDKNGNQIGWGGAMGPAQFIPSTWLGYVAKVEAATGKTTANPWDIRDAFMASAIKLTSNGADGTYQGDWNAAMRYFSGSTNSAYSFYGDSVMAQTAKYQADIDSLGK
jgi:membrane-bound lytic murein transglycosylase B